VSVFGRVSAGSRLGIIPAAAAYDAKTDRPLPNEFGSGDWH